jgi:hypothetical protein
MMSLLSTHVILHYHRNVNYHNNNNINTTSSNINTASDSNDNLEETGVQLSTDIGDDTSEKHGMKALGGLSTGYVIVAAISLLLSMIIYLAGVIVESFEVTSTRGTESESTSYSITSIGLEIPKSYIDSSDLGTRFIQAMWFFLAVVMPLWCSFLFLILYTFPGLSKIWMERIFTMAEIAFAWSCAEVLLISTIFAVLQMPIFGNGLVENDCTTCFVITSRILPKFALLCVGTVLNVSVNVWLYRKAHSAIYHQS